MVKQGLWVTGKWLGRLIIGLFVVVGAISVVWWKTSAGGTPANIVVVTDDVLGPMPTPWRSFAQGGEALETFLDKNPEDITNLMPRFIRIDHIYDILAKVEKGPGGVKVNWDGLDRVVRLIQKTGATPFLSLSYMPPSISSGDSVAPPNDWNDWSRLVQLTIEHYSGTLGIPGVYYEVWNEPDLFGKWRAGGTPNYFELYRYAAIGAARAGVSKKFFLGGPSTTAPYQSWVEGFFDFVKENNLRLDFYSWHRYSADLDRFKQDADSIDGWFGNHPDFVRVPKIISEFGISGQRDPRNDSSMAAAQEIAVVSTNITKLQSLAAFSIKDADGPEGKMYWGDWGLLTSDKSGAVKKPRYWAITFLNRLGPDRISLDGQGSWVKGLAAKKGDVYQLLLVNYDPGGNHTETVPVKFTNLRAGDYNLRLNFLSGETKREVVTPTNGEVSEQIYLKPNAIVLIEVASK